MTRAYDEAGEQVRHAQEITARVTARVRRLRLINGIGSAVLLGAFFVVLEFRPEGGTTDGFYVLGALAVYLTGLAGLALYQRRVGIRPRTRLADRVAMAVLIVGVLAFLGLQWVGRDWPFYELYFAPVFALPPLIAGILGARR